MEAIREHLKAEFQVQVNKSSLIKYCKSRGFVKGENLLKEPEQGIIQSPPVPVVSTPAAALQPPPAQTSLPATSLTPPSQPETHSYGKAMTREEIDAFKEKAAREVAEADAAKAAENAKWNFAATEAEIFRATTPGYDRP